MFNIIMHTSLIPISTFQNSLLTVQGWTSVLEGLRIRNEECHTIWSTRQTWKVTCAKTLVYKQKET